MQASSRQPLTRHQVRRVDECAVHELHYPSIILMEHAGSNAARWIDAHLTPKTRRAHIVCGTGNNGGDGFVIARQLHNAGWQVRVHLIGDPQRMTRDAATNRIIARAIGIPIEVLTESAAINHAIGRFEKDSVVVDALLGTGFEGAVRGPVLAAIRALNAADVAAVVAVDVPSGVDCDTGAIVNVGVHATHTVTFVAPKAGFDQPAAEAFLGKVVVADIGTPPELVDQVLAEHQE
jgi:NAD(P)H-hydrate epimerase